MRHKQTGEPTRCKTVVVKLTEIQYDRLQGHAATLGFSMNECLRRMIDRTKPEQLANKEG